MPRLRNQQLNIYDYLLQDQIQYDGQIYTLVENKIKKQFPKSKYMNLDNKWGVQILEVTKTDGDIIIDGQAYMHTFINPYKYFKD